MSAEPLFANDGMPVGVTVCQVICTTAFRIVNVGDSPTYVAQYWLPDGTLLVEFDDGQIVGPAHALRAAGAAHAFRAA